MIFVLSIALICSLALVGSKLAQFWLTPWANQYLTEKLLRALREVDAPALLTPMVNERLDNVLEQFKRDVPLAGLFLTEGTKSKIKGLGTGEILRSWPDICDMVGRNMSSRVDLCDVSRLIGAVLGGLAGLFLGLLIGCLS